MTIQEVEPLPEAASRVLRRIALLIREHATVEITLKLFEGGIRDYRETRSLAAKDLDPATGDEAGL